MAKDNASIVLYVGLLYLAYITMKSWGIISVSSTAISNWKPLTDQQLQSLKVY